VRIASHYNAQASWQEDNYFSLKTKKRNSGLFSESLKGFSNDKMTSLADPSNAAAESTVRCCAWYCASYQECSSSLNLKTWLGKLLFLP
jgi:hypothetical protein